MFVFLLKLLFLLVAHDNSFEKLLASICKTNGFIYVWFFVIKTFLLHDKVLD